MILNSFSEWKTTKLYSLLQTWLAHHFLIYHVVQSNIKASSVFHLRMRQLGVIRDNQAFSAAEDAREEYFFCGPSPGMFLFILCLSRMTSEISHGSLLTARFRTRLL